MILPHFGDFYLEPENDYVRLNWKDDSGNDYVFSPDQFSDGSIRFIALATLLLQPEKTMPRMIIIDEPELGLHPYAIEQLIQMIKDASVHSQVIIATQSPQLIDGFSLDSIVVLEQDDETKSTVAHKLDKERLKEWIEEYNEKFMSPYIAAKLGIIDEVIAPEDTRRKIRTAFESLTSKERTELSYLHGNIPL